MSQFAPITDYLRRRLRRTRFDEVETFKQLLLLERLVLMPLRDWRGEVVFLGLCALHPDEAKSLIREARCQKGNDTSTDDTCLDWRQFTTNANEDQRQRSWRERVAWLEAGGRL